MFLSKNYNRMAQRYTTKEGVILICDKIPDAVASTGNEFHIVLNTPHTRCNRSKHIFVYPRNESYYTWITSDKYIIGLKKAELNIFNMFKCAYQQQHV